MQIEPNNIPDEMKMYRQFICWRYVDRGGDKPTKVPFNPLTGAMASVTEPSSWCGFDEAVLHSPQYDGIGFVLTKNDPYTFIDLDDTKGNAENIARQTLLFNECDSYSERSPSGTGLHIIVKGHIPNGRRRASIEVYSSERYMTMTGNVFHARPIAERQSVIQLLWAQMGGEANALPTYDGNAPETMTDAEVIERSLNAVNGEKFKQLLEGNWRNLYPSQSEADIAFTNIIAFYTQNAKQIVRIFHASPLGQRDKAKLPHYLNSLIRKAFDQLLPPPDIEGMDMAWREVETPKISGGTEVETIVGGTAPAFDPAHHPQHDLLALWQPVPITPPPGLLGDIAQFIYSAAPRPVAATAIAGAIGLMAGIIGRSYNVSGTGLNQYVLLLAPTGTGKEGMARGISKLMGAVINTQCPGAADFRGPSNFASGQALIRQLAAKTPCFLSIIGEFGLKMQQLASPRASNNEIFLKQVLLELYNKSGAGDVLDPAVFADKDKNISAIQRPAVSILGEATPETFYRVIDESLISDGLLPRFMILEYTGKRPRRNKDAHKVEPSVDLVNRLGEICAYSLTLQSPKNDCVLDVGIEPEALDFLDRLDELVDDTINATDADTLRHLWNRAHIKTLKLAALVAVGCNFISPRITLEHAQWAYNVICTDIVGIVRRFSNGEIGKNTEENRQGWWVLKTCRDFLTRPYQDVAKYGVPDAMHKDYIIPLSYISRRLASNPAFKNDPLRSTLALKRAVQGLLDNGDIREVGKNFTEQRYKFSGRAFTIDSPEKLAASMGEEPPEERRGRPKSKT